MVTLISWFNFIFCRNCRGTGRMDMGKLLPKGRRAGCRSASGGSRTLSPVRPTVRPNKRANKINRQPDHCPLKRGGLGGFGRSQIPVDQCIWSEPVNWSTTEQVVWTEKNFHFRSTHITQPRIQSYQLIFTLPQKVISLVTLFNCVPPLTITDPIAAFTGLLWNNLD